MLEMKVDIWEIHKQTANMPISSMHIPWICITTNGFRKNNGEAVMGRGCAKQCADLYPDFPERLGLHMNKVGNTLICWGTRRIITFPVKHHWKEMADPKLIEKSCVQLREWMQARGGKDKVYLPRPGCGNGQLDYEKVVRPILLKHFQNNDNLIVVTNEGEDNDVEPTRVRRPSPTEPTKSAEAGIAED